MSVRANWHLSSLDDAEDDDPMFDLLNQAKPIDLSTDRARLTSELQSLTRAEAALSNRTGIECDRKWVPGTSCFDCPLYARSPKQGAHYEICRIGRSQETVLQQMERHTEIEELEVLAHRLLLEEECAELAEAVLPVEDDEAAVAA